MEIRSTQTERFTLLFALLILFSFSCQNEKQVVEEQSISFQKLNEQVSAQADAYALSFHSNEVALTTEEGTKVAMKLEQASTPFVSNDHSEVVYEDAFEKIDLKFYDKGDGNAGYDFILEAGADVEDIQMSFATAENVELIIAENGDLLIPNDKQIIRHTAPVSYQIIGEEKVAVESKFVINEETVSLKLKILYGKGN